MKKTREKLKNKMVVIGEELFQVSLITYLIFLIIETIQEGFVTNFFNINILLILILIGGITKITLSSKKNAVTTIKIEEKKIDLVYIITFGLVGGALVYYKTSELGTISIAISIITSLIVCLLLYILSSEE